MHEHDSLNYEPLYRLEIASWQALAEEFGAYRELFNEVRAHENLDFRTPSQAYLAPPEPNLSEPRLSKKPDPGKTSKKDDL